MGAQMVFRYELSSPGRGRDAEYAQSQHGRHKSEEKRKTGASVTGGRCYDHNFLRFFQIFGKLIGVFLKYQCYDPFFKILLYFVPKTPIYSLNFSAKIFKKS
jgi:hypothetical protein